MLSFTHTGSFKKTEDFLQKMSKRDIRNILNKYGREGVNALRSATPMDSGATAASWDYKVEVSRGSQSITWTNSHTEGGAPIAIMLQYGHGTGTGGYVRGRNYINPALKPIFDRLAEDVWKAVTTA